jgi:PilZ domain-containing protein
MPTDYAGESGGAEKRTDRRQSMNSACWIDIGDGKEPIKCRVSNISHAGALLCDAPGQLPDEFNLYLTRDGNVGRRCRVVRRSENKVGLNFISRRVPKPDWPEVVQI